jgi:hypothetical protein
MSFWEEFIKVVVTEVAKLAVKGLVTLAKKALVFIKAKVAAIREAFTPTRQLEGLRNDGAIELRRLVLPLGLAIKFPDCYRAFRAALAVSRWARVTLVWDDGVVFGTFKNGRQEA